MLLDAKVERDAGGSSSSEVAIEDGGAGCITFASNHRLRIGLLAKYPLAEVLASPLPSVSHKRVLRPLLKDRRDVRLVTPSRLDLLEINKQEAVGDLPRLVVNLDGVEVHVAKERTG
jgi:hypothetical protein